MLDVRLQRLLGPAGRRFGDEARQLAMHLRQRGEPRDRRRPSSGSPRAVADRRLRAMIDDDAQRGIARREGFDRLDVARIRSTRRTRGRARSAFRSPVRDRGFAIHVSSGRSCSIGRTPLNFGSCASASITLGRVGSNKRHPADHARNRRLMPRQVQQIARFVDGRRRLHHHRSFDARALRATASRSAGPNVRYRIFSSGVSHS